MSLNLSDIRARLDAVEPATTIEDWIASDFARPLAPGTYTITEPIDIYSKHGMTFQGPANSLVDPIGWGRSLWPFETQGQCIVMFDFAGTDHEDAPGMTFRGCQGMTFRGINFCRTTPGAIIQDENAEGRNSGMMEFFNCGFYTRSDGGEVYVDPYDRVGVVTDNTGYYGLQAVGYNGTDNYQFHRCDFHRLDRCYNLLTPQCTRMHFENCAFRQCNNVGWHGVNTGDPSALQNGSGNPAFYGCNRYDSGPVVFVLCSTATCSMLWAGGWIDASSGSPMESLVDFSATAYGHLTILGGNGKQLNAAAVAIAEPLVVPAYTALRTTIYVNGRWPNGQELLPDGWFLNSDQIAEEE
jgi:hypothetical protein